MTKMNRGWSDVNEFLVYFEKKKSKDVVIKCVFLSKLCLRFDENGKMITVQTSSDS